MRPDNPEHICEVAVIIPTYNCGSYIAGAIESVLAQTYRDFRIYVIDDGSTDNTAEVTRFYADQCVYIWQPNAGCAAARNHGIRASSSKYIAFLDADDLWHPKKLELQVRLLDQQADVGLVASNFSMVGRLRTVDAYLPPDGIPPAGHNFEFILDHGLATPSIVLRRSAVEEVGVFNESLVVTSDMNLWLRIAARWKSAIIPEVLTTVQSRQESLSGLYAGTMVSLSTGLASLQHVESMCPDLSLRDRKALNRKLAGYYYKSGCFQLSGAGPVKPARKHLMMAMRYKPFHPLAVIKIGASFLPGYLLRPLVEIYRKIFR